MAAVSAWAFQSTTWTVISTVVITATREATKTVLAYSVVLTGGRGTVVAIIWKELVDFEAISKNCDSNVVELLKGETAEDCFINVLFLKFGHVGQQVPA